MQLLTRVLAYAAMTERVIKLQPLRGRSNIRHSIFRERLARRPRHGRFLMTAREYVLLKTPLVERVRSLSASCTSCALLSDSENTASLYPFPVWPLPRPCGGNNRDRPWQQIHSTFIPII